MIAFSWRKIITAIVVVYSLLVVSTATPVFAELTNIPVILFYIFVPGLMVTLIFGETYNFLERLSLSIIFSLTIVLSLLAIRQIAGQFPLPYNVIIPALTILITTYYYFRGGKTVLKQIPSSSA